MLLDNMKVFAKKEKEMKTPTQTISLYSQDIGMEQTIEKCAMLIMKTIRKEDLLKKQSYRIKNVLRYFERGKSISTWEYGLVGFFV